jgi:hypothetical protein
MDDLIRFAAYLILGAIILFCNIWYLRALRSVFEANEYVIMPIRLLGKEDKDGALGIGLAQMLQVRLKSIERDLADAQRQLSAPGPERPIASRSLPAGTISLLPLISADTVKMPTSLLEPANINVTVAGVNVTGAVDWLQNLLVRQRTLSFTIDLSDNNKMVVAGDATPLSGGDDGSIWFESAESRDKVISQLAYALLLKRITSAGGEKIGGLVSVGDFAAFADGLHKVVALNRRIALGGQPRPEEFGSIFHNLEPIANNVSGWPEMKYFAADLAERAGENGKAVRLYTEFKAARSSRGTSAEVRALIDSGSVDTKLAALSSTAMTAGKSHGGFDWPVTRQGATENAVVYYETALGSVGSEIAQAVLGKIEDDLAKLKAFFGGTTLPKPLNIIAASIGGAQDGSGGAYHYACSAEDLYVDVKIKPALDPDRTSFFAVTQAVDVFGAALNKGWDCGSSAGTGLKRALADELYPKEIAEFTTAAKWLDSRDRPDYVSVNDPTDINPVSTGCAVLFLNYMHTQLKIPWEKIVPAGGPTLGQTYANLGLGNDGFTKFKQLMDAHFPVGTLSRLTTDNPFPLDERPNP